MYAIVEIAGKQYKVEKDQKIFVDRLAGNEGDKVEFDNVLLKEDGGNVEVGNPTTGGKISASILSQGVKGDKVIVFKKKRRKGFKKKNGHRQHFTQLLIESL